MVTLKKSEEVKVETLIYTMGLKAEDILILLAYQKLDLKSIIWFYKKLRNISNPKRMSYSKEPFLIREFRMNVNLQTIS